MKMTQQQIEQAAEEMMPYSKDGSSAGRSVFGKHYKRGFRAGAQWRINSVWHDAGEKPKFKGKVEKEMFLLFCNSQKYGLMLISQDEWDDFVERGMFHKWAYVDDLLPERKEARCEPPMD